MTRKLSSLFKLLFFIIPFAIISQSCCTKMHCENFSFIGGIYFYNFNELNPDSVTVLSYKNNKLIDSVVTNLKSGDDYLYAQPFNSFDKDYSYKIIINNTGKTYTLTKFETTRKGCNKCFPFRPKSDYYEVLSGYSINGEKQEATTVKIINK